MRFTFRSEPEESFRGHAAIGELANRGHKIHWAIAIALIPITWVLMFSWQERWILMTSLFFVYTVVLLIALVIEARIRLKRLIVADPSSALDYELDIDDSGVSVVFGHARSQAGWGAIRRVVETKEFYFFMTGFAAAQHLPKRAIGGTERELRALIRDRSPDRGMNLLPDAPPAS